MMIFIEWFYRTMAREWSLIDRYRLDKFMMVSLTIRFFCCEIFSLTFWDFGGSNFAEYGGI